jgi:tetratricopeptide (TPR) repeat protein
MRASQHLGRTLARVCLSAAAMFGAATLNAQILTKDDLQKEIATYEAAARQNEASNMAALQAGRIWFHLGTLYQDAGKYGQSELAFERAMRFLTIEPVSKADLAATIDDLGTLYLEMGKVKESERAESKALKMREQSGLKSDLSRSWYHLATLYLRKRLKNSRNAPWTPFLPIQTLRRRTRSAACSYSPPRFASLTCTHRPSPNCRVVCRWQTKRTVQRSFPPP